MWIIAQVIGFVLFMFWCIAGLLYLCNESTRLVERRLSIAQFIACGPFVWAAGLLTAFFHVIDALGDKNEH